VVQGEWFVSNPKVGTSVRYRDGSTAKVGVLVPLTRFRPQKKGRICNGSLAQREFW
jgi:hypothetical protein